MRTMNAVIRLRESAGWLESTLGAHVSYLFSRYGSVNYQYQLPWLYLEYKKADVNTSNTNDLLSTDKTLLLTFFTMQLPDFVSVP